MGDVLEFVKRLNVGDVVPLKYQENSESEREFVFVPKEDFEDFLETVEPYDYFVDQGHAINNLFKRK